MKFFAMTAPLLLAVLYSSAQNVGIGTNTPHASAALEIKASNKGILIPRTSTAGRTAIVNPAKGLMLYDTTTSSFWYYNSSAWTQMGATSNGWSLTGNAGTNTANYIGTTDLQPLRFKVNNSWAGEIQPVSGNIFLGLNAGRLNTSGILNTAMGAGALANNTQSNNNVAVGDSTLFTQNGSAASGSNTAVGTHTLYKNLNGSANTAIGGYALYSNVDGSFNTSIGLNSLSNNLSGDSNTAVGTRALQFNNAGSYNTATGATALRLNTSGTNNTANGYQALYGNTTGNGNTATGSEALFSGGVACTATGTRALYSNYFGFNTADGFEALFNTTDGSRNTAVGHLALHSNVRGSFNTVVGAEADVVLSNQSNSTAIGWAAIVNASDKIQLGNSSIQIISTSGAYTSTSDGRFKENLQADVKGLDFIMKLHPLTYNFNYNLYDQFIHNGSGISAEATTGKDPGINQAINAKERVQYKLQLSVRTSKRETGFVAQDVEKAVKESGYTGFNGVYAPTNSKDNYSLDYSKMVVPLVKAVQEQQAIIEEQNKKIELLLKEIQGIKEKLK